MKVGVGPTVERSQCRIRQIMKFLSFSERILIRKIFIPLKTIMIQRVFSNTKKHVSVDLI
jgi:hypothetical protein